VGNGLMFPITLVIDIFLNQIVILDGVPLCKEGLCMHHDGIEPSWYRIKNRCWLASRKYGCSYSKYGRTVHLAMKDNPRSLKIPRDHFIE